MEGTELRRKVVVLMMAANRGMLLRRGVHRRGDAVDRMVSSVVRTVRSCSSDFTEESILLLFRRGMHRRGSGLTTIASRRECAVDGGILGKLRRGVLLLGEGASRREARSAASPGMLFRRGMHLRGSGFTFDSFSTRAVLLRASWDVLLRRGRRLRGCGASTRVEGTTAGAVTDRLNSGSRGSFGLAIGASLATLWRLGRHRRGLGSSTVLSCIMEGAVLDRRKGTVGSGKAPGENTTEVLKFRDGTAGKDVWSPSLGLSKANDVKASLIMTVFGEVDTMVEFGGGFY